MIEYSRIYTLRNEQEKSIKVESWRSFREEMNVLGIQDSNVFKCSLWNMVKRERKRVLIKIIGENSLLTYKYHN
ncbi:hypothetical protein N2V79_28920 [Bacillus sp. CH_70]|uniref:hypothetical protein n=1 Tax=Bacillus sp. CH_70 TaxID=2978215 RepID=UPI0030FBD6C5